MKYQSKNIFNRSEDATTFQDNSSSKDDPKLIQEVNQGLIKYLLLKFIEKLENQK